MNILHLSDLHFGIDPGESSNWHSQVAGDLEIELKCKRLDALILSGDVGCRSEPEEYRAAERFVRQLCKEFHLGAEQIVIVPGNHDLNWELSEQAYDLTRRKEYQGPADEHHIIDKGEHLEVRDEKKYRERFRHFQKFYQAVKGEAYPAEYARQAVLYHFPSLLILGLNSAWQLDHHYQARAGIHPEALGNALTEIRGHPDIYENCLKLAVWHHPLAGAAEDRIHDSGFLQRLAQAGFRIALHGHIHKAETALYRYDQSTGGRRLDIISAGTFGAPVREWARGYFLQYNFLKLTPDKLLVETRRREEINGVWAPDARWTQGPGQDPLPRYEIILSPLSAPPASDIFISYARADDESLPDATQGWVSFLVNALKIHLDKKIRAGAYSLRMDEAADEASPLLPAIVKKIENAALFVPILSPAYMASRRCREELQLFLNKAGSAGRIIPVERACVEHPEEIRGLLGAVFWEKGAQNLPGPDADTAYYRTLDDLARQIAAKLHPPKTEKEHGGATVFLAEVTDDLTAQRDQLKRYFDQHHVRVLPDRRYDFAVLQADLDRDLGQCQLFVQLLSDKAGNGYPRFQHQRAQAAKVPVLQWHERKLDSNHVADDEQRALLESGTVTTATLPEFQNDIFRHLFKQREMDEDVAEDTLVFVHAAPEDMRFARQIDDALDEHGIDCTLPLESAHLKPAEIRHYLKRNLQHCDAVIVPCEHTPPERVEKILLRCQSVTGQREKPVKVIAVWHKSAVNKAPPVDLLSNVKVLDCAVLYAETCLPLFITMLQA
ncbi:MAG: TIR domain-containing protein [Gammaproteobacteria bacterium]|nr:TIR domain-containing protein [Gammaproteobacteria bacterium]